MGNYLAISDLQIPFEHEKSLKHCLYLKKHFNVSNDNILIIGDEFDQNWAGMYPKDPDAWHTANQEINIARDKARAWYKAFPKARAVNSNHGLRLIKKAAFADLPSQVIKSYRDIYQIPEGWNYADFHLIKEKYPFLMKHGMSYSGRTPYATAPQQEGCSVLFGHLHSRAGIAHIVTDLKEMWGMCVGALIDIKSYAFKYERFAKVRPTIGAGVVLDKGKTPLFIPL